MGGLTKVFSPKIPKAPDQPGAVAAPDESDPIRMEARRKKMREEQTRTGRDATNLSGSPGTYTNPSLGL